MLPDTWEKIEFELAQLQRLIDSHRNLLRKVTDTEPDDIELSALSAFLHSFYTGIENVFKQIVTDIYGVRPTSERWHSELLRMMSESISARPPMISQALFEKLVGYMGFRHVFRHAYPFQLKLSRMKPLVMDAETVLMDIRNACENINR